MKCKILRMSRMYLRNLNKSLKKLTLKGLYHPSGNPGFEREQTVASYVSLCSGRANEETLLKWCSFFHLCHTAQKLSRIIGIIYPCFTGEI